MANRLAIIPARSGSKGLANKNILMLMGKPLIAYTIEAAVNSKCLTSCFIFHHPTLEYRDTFLLQAFLIRHSFCKVCCM